MSKTCRKCGEKFPETSEYFAVRTGGVQLTTQCKKCIAVHYKEYRHKNKSKVADYWKVYRQKNKEAIATIRKRSYELNKEHAADWSREYFIKNKEKMSIGRKAYRQNNKELIVKHAETRRARKNNLPATLTSEQWGSIKNYFDNKCAYCGAEVTLTQDHLVALIRGGGYTAENIIPACGHCNSSKNTQHFEDWYRKQSFYDADREQKILQIGAIA